jgi:inosine-uridine nucleoside N-ribohydrolase
MGINKPLTRDVRYGYHVHGPNAFGGIEYDVPKQKKQPEHAVWALIDKIMADPGEITLVALGPLTNVAAALTIEPKVAQNVKELVLMGGAVLTHGNATQVASANLWYDPEAAAIVYRSGAPIVQAGLDVCHRIIFYTDEFDRLRQAKTPTTEMLVKITKFLADLYQQWPRFARGGVIAYNDVPSIAYCIQPELFDIEQYHVQISTHDELTKGQTVTDVTGIRGERPNAKVLMDVKDKALKELFIERVENYQA